MVDLNEKRKERKRGKKIHKNYFIFVNYKLIINYEDIKLFLPKKLKPFKDIRVILQIN